MRQQATLNHTDQTIRETVGIFRDRANMHEAIADLESSGFERRQISVLGSEPAVKKVFGISHLSAERLADNPNTPRSPDVKEEDLSIGQGALISGGVITGVVAAVVAAGGVLVPSALVTTALVGGLGGGAIGAVLAKLLGDKYAEFFEKQIEEGGILVWVKTSDKQKEMHAKTILQKHGAQEVYVHEIPANPAS